MTNPLHILLPFKFALWPIDLKLWKQVMSVCSFKIQLRAKFYDHIPKNRL